MRLAIAGKGGAGKTTISAAVARLWARAGAAVVAIDADANPNLAVALGLPSGAAELRSIPPSLVSRRRGGAGLLEPVDDILSRYAATGPDGVRLLGMGAPAHADEGCLCSAHAVVSALLEDLGSDDRNVVVDMEASPEHLSRGTIRHVDTVLLIAEPYYRCLETVRRMAALAAELPVHRIAVVANKIRGPQDHAAVAEFCDRHRLALLAAVPWCEGVLAADQRRVGALDWPPAAPMVRAIEALVQSLASRPAA